MGQEEPLLSLLGPKNREEVIWASAGKGRGFCFQKISEVVPGAKACAGPWGVETTEKWPLSSSAHPSVWVLGPLLWVWKTAYASSPPHRLLVGLSAS